MSSPVSRWRAGTIYLTRWIYRVDARVCRREAAEARIALVGRIVILARVPCSSRKHARRHQRCRADALHRAIFQEIEGPRAGLWLPSSTKPQGTLIPQMPARFAAIVKMSARYILSGSSVRSPMEKREVRGGGTDDDVHFLKCGGKVPPYEGADFLGAKVVAHRSSHWKEHTCQE